MTETKLSEKEMQEIWEEADRLYPPKSSGVINGCIYFCYRQQANAHIAAVTRERERVKDVLIRIFEQCENSRLGHPADEVIPEIEKIINQALTAISNYQKTKEQ